MSDDRFRIVTVNPGHQQQVEKEIEDQPLPQAPDEIIIVVPTESNSTVNSE